MMSRPENGPFAGAGSGSALRCMTFAPIADSTAAFGSSMCACQYFTMIAGRALGEAISCTRGSLFIQGGQVIEWLLVEC
jgi:hypothetical protein